MRKLVVFSQVSVDGYFVDGKGDMSWAHQQDPEWNEFVAGNARGGGVLLFGRITYEMMASFWPTPQAHAIAPVVAERMNQLPKVVFSRTLAAASWSRTTLLAGDLATEVRTLKAAPGDDLVLLGSGSIVAQLAQARLIDDYQLVVNPLVLGSGRSLFAGVGAPFGLERTETRTFANGNVLVCYQARP
jgi:dihydrofolate reductase